MPVLVPRPAIPQRIEHIPLSRQLGGGFAAAGILTLGAGLAFALGALGDRWMMRLGGARLDPVTSRIVVALVGGALTLMAAAQLARLLTLRRASPLSVRFGAGALELPTATFRGPLRPARLPWRDIQTVSVRRARLSEAVHIHTAGSRPLILPGALCRKPWKPARIAEAIRQETARRSTAMAWSSFCRSSRGGRSPGPV